MVISKNTDLQIRVIEQDDTVTILLMGDFAFSSHPNFTATYRRLLSNAAISRIIVDFKNVKRMDSSALGMLLTLLEHAQKLNKSLILCQPSQTAAAVFDIANFHKIFTIQSE